MGRQTGWWQPSLSHRRRRVRWRPCSDDCSPPSPPKTIPTELEGLLRRLLGEVRAPKPAPPAKSGIAKLETLLQGLLLGSSTPAPQAQPGPIRQDWATIVCLSCGKAGRGMRRCPKLNETFPFMLPGWAAEKVGDSYVMISPPVAAECCRVENGN